MIFVLNPRARSFGVRFVLMPRILIHARIIHAARLMCLFETAECDDDQKKILDA